MKKILLIGSLAASGVIFAGCGSNNGGSVSNVTIDSVMEDTKTAMESVKSVTTKMNIDFDLKVSASANGQSQDFDMKISGEGTIEAVLDKFASHQVYNMKQSLSGVGSETKSEIYMAVNPTDSKKVDIYSTNSTGGTSSDWTKSSVDFEKASEQININLYDLYKDNKDSFSMDNKTQTYEGSNCYVVKADIGFDQISKYFANSGNDFSQLGLDSISDIKAKTVYYIDSETKEVKGVEVDMAESIKSIFEAALKEQLDSSGGKVDIKVNSSKITTVNTYNNVKSIDIPKEITDSAN